jgi:GH15 family glucan-1,4-alpha-glucosidase
MTRPLTLTGAGGRLSYQYAEDGTVRDIYWPFVGQANQITRLPQRLALRVDAATSWLDEPGWTRQLDYDGDTLVGRSVYENSDLGLRVTVRDAVDPEVPVYVRRLDIEDLSRVGRQVDIFAHHHFEMPGSETGDTSLYDPDAQAILSFKNHSYVFTGTEPSFGEAYDAVPFDVHWRVPPRDIFANVARGALSRSAVAHNKVNSVVGLAVLAPATVYTWDAWGRSEGEARAVHDRVRSTGPQAVLDRAFNYWCEWLRSDEERANFELDLAVLPPELRSMYRRSLLQVVAQQASSGAILAGTDSDVRLTHPSGDVYNYCWPRDGALSADTLSRAGHFEEAEAFFRFCLGMPRCRGLLPHKVNADGTLASTWLSRVPRHPYDLAGVQEDESALVVWALARHVERSGHTALLDDLYEPLVTGLTDALVEHIAPTSGLPFESWDLWEERQGVHAFTVASIYGAMLSAAWCADSVGDTPRADKYRSEAAELKRQFRKWFWIAELGRFARTVELDEHGSIRRDEKSGLVRDRTPDASLHALYSMGMFESNDPEVKLTVAALEDELRVATAMDPRPRSHLSAQLRVEPSHNGVARYSGDTYYRSAQDQDFAHIPGPPWMITTLWTADHRILTAHAVGDVVDGLRDIVWVADRALASGVLPEQVDPRTGEHRSTSPLTWSHAALVDTITHLLSAMGKLARTSLDDIGDEPPDWEAAAEAR